MDDKLKNIDSYYRDNLANYKEETDRDIWKNMRWTLFWLRYRWYLGIGSIVLLFGLGFFIYTGSNILPEISINEELALVNISDTPEAKQEQLKDIKLVEKDTHMETKQTFSNNSTIVSNSGKAELQIKDYSITEIVDVDIEDSKPNLQRDKLLLSLIDINQQNISIATNPDTSFGYNRRKNNKRPKNNSNFFSVSIFMGPAYSQADISGHNPEYLSIRRDNEANHSSWTIGADIKLNLKNWIITTGLNYSEYYQNRSYKNSYLEYSPENSYYNYDTTWAWFFDPPDIGVPVVAGIDSNWVEVYNDITIDNSGLNRLKYIEVPLLVGYRYNANLISIELNTGIYMGFLMYSSVKVPDVVNNDEIVNMRHTNKTMLSYTVNASVYFHVDRNISLFVSPYFKNNLNSVFNSNYPVKQRFNSYGLNFGVNFRF